MARGPTGRPRNERGGEQGGERRAKDQGGERTNKRRADEQGGERTSKAASGRAGRYGRARRKNTMASGPRRRPATARGQLVFRRGARGESYLKTESAVAASERPSTTCAGRGSAADCQRGPECGPSATFGVRQGRAGAVTVSVVTVGFHAWLTPIAQSPLHFRDDVLISIIWYNVSNVRGVVLVISKEGKSVTSTSICLAGPPRCFPLAAHPRAGLARGRRRMRATMRPLIRARRCTPCSLSWQEKEGRVSRRGRGTGEFAGRRVAVEGLFAFFHGFARRAHP